MMNKQICLYCYKSCCVRMQATLAPQEVNRVKPARTKSLVWQYFDDNNDGARIFCVLCADVSIVTLRRITGSNTTGLRNHLQKKHEVEWRKLKAAESSNTPWKDPDKLSHIKSESVREVTTARNIEPTKENKYEESKVVEINDDTLSYEEMSILEGIDIIDDFGGMENHELFEKKDEEFEEDSWNKYEDEMTDILGVKEDSEADVIDIEKKNHSEMDKSKNKDDYNTNDHEDNEEKELDNDEEEESKKRWLEYLTTFIRKSNAEDYETKHSDGIGEVTKAELYECRTCSKAFTTKLSMQEHGDSVHKKTGYLCKYCEFSSIFRWNLRGHIKKIHKEKYLEKEPSVDSFSCTICKDACKSMDDLQTHMKIHHFINTRSHVTTKVMPDLPRIPQDVKPWSPSQVELNSVVRGMVEKLGKNLWQCKFCARQNRNPGHLKEHCESHIEGLSIPCDVCGKYFSTKGSLRAHRAKQKHYSERIIGFSRLPYLVENENQSDEIKEFRGKENSQRNIKGRVPCGLCSKSFRSNNILKAHRAQHKNNFGSNSSYTRMLPSNQNKLHKKKIDRIRSSITVSSQPILIKEKNSSVPDTTRQTFSVGLEDMLELKKMWLNLVTVIKANNKRKHMFRCNECGKEWIGRWSAYHHVDFHHLPHVKHKCDNCHKVFSNHTALKLHVKSKHGL